MHIVERLTRVGNEIRYDMTIEDPEVFLEPWVMPTRVLTLAQGAAADRIPAERANCEVYEDGQRHESGSTLTSDQEQSLRDREQGSLSLNFL